MFFLFVFLLLLLILLKLAQWNQFKKPETNMSRGQRDKDWEIACMLFSFWHENEWKLEKQQQIYIWVFPFLFQGLPHWLSNKQSTFNEGHKGSIPGSGRSPGGGHGSPLQHSCLENEFMDRGVCPAIVQGVAKSWTLLKQLTEHWCASYPHWSRSTLVLNFLLNTWGWRDSLSVS